MLIRSRAPVRIDFAGGWTDVAIFSEKTPGFVLNAAIDIYSYATIQVADPDSGLKRENEIGEHGVTIYSSDYDIYVEAKNIRELEYDGNVDLVKAAIKRLDVPDGFNIITQSVAPPGSGLGTSASMGVALIAVLAKYAKKPFLKYEMAEMASTIEREELGIRGGKQDQYGAALGAVNLMEFRGDDVKSSRLNLSENVSFELTKNLCLIYTGQSRLSGEVHEKVTQAYLNGESNTVDAIEEMKKITCDMKVALLKEDLESFAKLMDRNWECQKRLHPSVTNETIDGLFELAKKEGALGGKACGAGGGGCILFYCRPDAEHKVRQAMNKAGIRVIDFNFDPYGVVAWQI